MKRCENDTITPPLPQGQKAEGKRLQTPRAWPAALGVGIAALAALGIEVGSRLLTGKGIFDHLKKLSAGIEDRLIKWMKRQQVKDIVIKKFVFVFESINSIVSYAQKGTNAVIVKIFGKTNSGRKVYTGEQVTISVTKKKADELVNKREVEAGLAELGF